MTAETITIRTATVEDAASVAEFGARTFRDTFAWGNTGQDMAAYLATAFSPRIQAEQIADERGAFLLACTGDALVGYARLLRGTPTASIPGSTPIEVVRLYVDTPWIGRGVGARLMSACLEQAARWGCDVLWLDVWEHNPTALAFYERWGFSVVGRQEFLLGADVQNDLLMARPTKLA